VNSQLRANKSQLRSRPKKPAFRGARTEQVPGAKQSTLRLPTLLQSRQVAQLLSSRVPLPVRGAMGAPNHYVRWMDRPDAPRGNLTSRLGTIALVVTLLGLLAASILFAIRSFTLEGPPMPGVGYLAMSIGILFSLVIGVPLMALLFYSSRHGYDERASRDPWVDDDGEPQ
jgi:hypothetical protein